MARTRSRPPSAPAGSPAAPMTLGALAQAAAVGVETARYDQRRGPLPQPARQHGSVRRHPPAVAARLRFKRRAPRLGFTLDEIASPLQPAAGTDRRPIRGITAARLGELCARMADLQRMADVLEQVLHACEHAALPDHRGDRVAARGVPPCSAARPLASPAMRAASR